MTITLKLFIFADIFHIFDFFTTMKHLIISLSLLLSFQFWASALIAQQVVTGRITDASDGKPMPNASIYIANTTVGTFSDESGNYTITLPGEGSYEIIVYHIGYKTFFYKIDLPKTFHKIDVVLGRIDVEIQEVVVTPRKSYSKNDVDLFWYMLLRVKPSKKGLEVLNPEKVYFYFDNDSVLNVSCDEPVEIINHEMGYHIRYMLQSFKHDYRINNTVFSGRHFFEELIPQNSRQKNNWEKKRQEVYAVSLTHFIRALYRDKIHEEGFLLTKRDYILNRNTFFPLSDILQKEQDQVQVNIESPVYLACFSKPVTYKMIEKSDRTMFGSIEQDRLLGINKGFPVIMLFPQQFSIYPDGTYTETLIIQELRNHISGLSAMLPVEYGL